MTVVAIEDFIIRQLNILPPYAKDRKGLCKVMSFITHQRLVEDARDMSLQAELASTLELELSDLTRSDHERIRESW